jgi:hypothetical protein
MDQSGEPRHFKPFGLAEGLFYKLFSRKRRIFLSERIIKIIEKS